ncbi:GNAT family N-acetyltransferase [Singulisphaera sp. PoT]|uniref:GNAT family N-acetyltransferase n=1 Tax=Singulisphaera sp. PoT TaxID=3411797 RepID=UPI003BF4B93D
MSGAIPQVQPCTPRDREAALEILYRRVPPNLRPRLIANALFEAERGYIDLSGLWVAWKRGRIVGAMLTQALAGRAAAVWAPEVDPSWQRSAIAMALVRTALSSLQSQGFLIVQALLDDSTPRQGANDLSGGGIPKVTELIYLERDTRSRLSPPPGTPEFDWRGFGPETEPEFREILSKTYVNSLDMPELEGIRSLDDIMSGHRASGRFVPERWRIGRLRDDPETAAVLLLSQMPDRDAWEVAYLGLSLKARGRGLGRVVLAHALELASAHVPKLELAVDSRNIPATRLYEAACFVPFDRRSVHLARLVQEPGNSLPVK